MSVGHETAIAFSPTSLIFRGRTGAVVMASDFGPRGPWFEPWPGAVPCSLEQVTFTPCLLLVKPRKRWTDDGDGQTVTRLETRVCLMC